MAGIGVSLFDVETNRVMPSTSGVWRPAIKFGGAFLFQSALGAKIPFIGRYRKDIALVLAVAGVVDLMKLYVLPMVSQTVANIGLFNVGSPLIAAGDGGDDTTGNIYGNAPTYPVYG